MSNRICRGQVRRMFIGLLLLGLAISGFLPGVYTSAQAIQPFSPHIDQSALATGANKAWVEEVIVHSIPNVPGPAADWSVYGNQTGNDFGITVAGVGDVNGDTYADVLVGAPTYRNPELNEGRAYLFYGGANGLSTTPAWDIESNQASGFLGRAVAGAGDVNNDGYADVLIGAPGYGVGGTVFIYHGSATGLPATPNQTLAGDVAGESFGAAIAGMGDVNGDAYSDIVVGSPTYENEQVDEGRVTVFYGSATGIINTVTWQVESNKSQAQFGFSVDGAGDVNNDIFQDMVIGAPGYTDTQIYQGAVFVYHGRVGGFFNHTTFFTRTNQSTTNFGYDVAGVGDVDNDGFDDIIVAERLYDNGQTNEGAAFLFAGSALGIETMPSWSTESDQSDAANGTTGSVGMQVDGAGDINGDGYNDVLVSYSFYNNGETDEGIVELFYGTASGLATTSRTFESNQAAARFGSGLAGAGDVNNDGRADFIVGAPEYTDSLTQEGAAFAFYGMPSVSINSPSIQEGNAGTTNLVFSVELSSASTSQVTVDYATSNGIATAGSDYQATSGTLTFNAGVTSQTIAVPILGDTAVEPDETFSVTLSNPSQATIAQGSSTGTILNDDSATNVPGIVINNVTVVEGNSGTTNMDFTVFLDDTSTETISVDYVTSDTSAQAGSDYQAISGTLTFNPGVTELTLTVPIIGDTTPEFDEIFELILSNPQNAILLDGSGVGTILNDDGAVNVQTIYLPFISTP